MVQRALRLPLSLLLASGLVAGCRSSGRDAPARQTGALISDSAHGGSIPGVWFLDPIGDRPAVQGPFDSTLRPEVHIDVLGADGRPAGNGAGAVTATLRAYDAGGTLVFETSRAALPEDVYGFLGIESSAANIARVELDYGDTPLGEEIDDLLFE